MCGMLPTSDDSSIDFAHTLTPDLQKSQMYQQVVLEIDHLATRLTPSLNVKGCPQQANRWLTKHTWDKLNDICTHFEREEEESVFLPLCENVESMFEENFRDTH